MSLPFKPHIIALLCSAGWLTRGGRNTLCAKPNPSDDR